MDLPQQADAALAHPSRARLFASIQAATAPVGTVQLASAVGLHVNGVRRHLEQLRRAGLIERRKSTGGRGRPRDEWSIARTANPGGERPKAYADLARWLARVTPVGPRRLLEIERTGREIGRELVPAGADRTAESFEAALAALGFQPEMAVTEGATTCRLGNCPYRDSVRENPDVVCTLHRGITAGLLAELAPEGTLSAFVPHDPDLAGCIVEVSGTDWPAGAEEKP
jgi:predicted ArsR family transcriptional regulator